MPTLNYNPTPGVSATESTSGGFQTQRATPRAFGSDIGEGLSALGQRFEQAGDVIAKGVLERQTLFNQVAADDASNKALEGANKLLYGDPDTPGDVGFYGLKGEAAMRALPDVRKKLDDLINTHRGSLQNPNQQLLFNNETRRSRLMIMDQMGRHYDSESNKYTASVYEGQKKLGEQEMARGAAVGDKDMFDAGVAKQITAATKAGVFLGLGPEATQAKINEISANAAETMAEGLMGTDPVKALKFLEANREHLPPDKFLTLKNRVETKAREQIVSDVIRGRPSTGGVPNLVRGGAGTLDYATIKQYALDAGFRGEAADIITAITFPESGGDPNAHNPKYPDDSYGLTQINALAHGPKAKEALGNPKRAMELAFEVSKGGTNFRPWTTYTSGAYRQYLSPQTQPAAFQVAKTDAPDQIINVPLEPGEVPDSEIPGLPDLIKEKLKDPRVANDPRMQEALIKKLRQEANIAYTNNQRQRQLAEYAQKAEIAKAENEYIARLFPKDGAPSTVTPQEIANDPRLATPESKTKMISWFERETKADPLKEVSRVNAMRLYSRMIADFGDPEKITTPEPIEKEFVEGKLTKEDFKWLREDVIKKRSETGDSLHNTRDDFLKGYEFAISKSNPLAGLLDPDGLIQFSRFKFFVDQEIKRIGQEKKDPMNLFNPNSPEFLGAPAIIDKFRKPLDQSMKDIAGRFKPNPAYNPLQTPSMPGSPVFTAPIPAPARQPGESVDAYKKRTGR